DAELKRGGLVHRMPIGINIDPGLILPEEHDALHDGTAWGRAMMLWYVAHRLQVQPTFENTAFSAPAVSDLGYLLPRGPWPNNLARELQRTQNPAVLSEYVRRAVARAHLDPLAVERLREAERMLGLTLFDDHVVQEFPDINEVLTPGAQVCFTGSVVRDGRTWSREEIKTIAREAGYEPVANVTKTRCDVLIVAEAGSQSRKSRQAIEYGKPIFTVEEFFAHINHPGVVPAR
ncbi:MAG TPA: AAA family ATPase, partial [Beutenbergiaceae bacterium]|nr:AAA family ATPase [Beutenbergiaceae bacterium]